MRFDGAEISALGEAARDALRRTSMGFVFQALALVAVMSAFENVEFALRVAGYPGRERRRRAEECLGLVGLRKRMDHRPHELSGGEQQRVAIARAIAHRPKVVFADEPTAELDTHTGLAVVKLFRDLVARLGRDGGHDHARPPDDGARRPGVHARGREDRPMSDEPAPATPMILCENLVKIYKVADLEVVALQGLDLAVDRGEIMAIIGNSGSGKSTLLNIIGGLDRPSAGRIAVDGKDLLKIGDADLVAYRRDTVGFVWQSNARNLVPWLTARENVELPMLVGRRPDGPRGPASCSSWSASRTARRAGSCSCPAASSSAWPSPSASPTARRCSWPTSRPARWTRPSPCTCSTCSTRPATPTG